MTLLLYTFIDISLYIPGHETNFAMGGRGKGIWIDETRDRQGRIMRRDESVQKWARHYAVHCVPPVSVGAVPVTIF